MSIVYHKQEGNAISWNSPRTWVTSELVTAAIMNTHVRDNLNYLNTQVSSQFMLSAAGGRPSTTDGCGEPAQTEFTTNDVDLMSAAFASAITERMQWTHPLPDDYDGGVVTAEIYWYCANSSTNISRWRFEAQAFGNGDSLDASWGTAKFVTDANTGANKLNIAAATADVTIANTPVAGDIVQWRLTRTGSDAGDTLLFDAELLYVVINYTRT